MCVPQHSLLSLESGDIDEVPIYNSRIIKAKDSPFYPLYSAVCVTPSQTSSSSSSRSSARSPLNGWDDNEVDSKAMQQYWLLGTRVINNISITFVVLKKYATTNPEIFSQFKKHASSSESEHQLLRNLLSTVEELERFFEKNGHLLPPCAPTVVTAYVNSLLTDLMWTLGDKDAALKWATRHLATTQHPVFAHGLMAPFHELRVLEILHAAGSEELFGAQVAALQPFKDLNPTFSTMLAPFEELVSGKRKQE